MDGNGTIRGARMATTNWSLFDARPARCGGASRGSRIDRIRDFCFNPTPLQRNGNFGDAIEIELWTPTSPSNRDAMQRDIEIQREKMRRRYTHSPRHTIQVDFYSYWDELSKERCRKPASRPVITADPVDARKAA